MSSRAEQKAQARAIRERREHELQAAAKRRQRLYRLAGVLAAAAVVLVIAIALSSSSGKSGSAAPSAAAATAVDQLLKGIPQSGSRLGKATSPVTVTEYGDLQCPICRDFALGAENKLIAGEVRSGAAKLIYRSLQTATQDPATFETQQVAALAAGRQQGMWNYIELFYHQQGAEGSGYVTAGYLDGLARQVPGLDIAQWQKARDVATLPAQVRTDATQAHIKGLNSTPSIVVQGPKGTAAPIVGSPDYATLQKAIQQVS